MKLVKEKRRANMKKIILALILLFALSSNALASIKLKGNILDSNINAALSFNDIESRHGLLYIYNYDIEFDVNILNIHIFDDQSLEIELESEDYMDKGIYKILYLEINKQNAERYFDALEINNY
jgi:hypothetical protein